ALVSFDDSASQRLPDVLVGKPDKGQRSHMGSDETGVATIEAAIVRLAKHEDEVGERWIEILHLPDMQLVTAIEILSPTNKIGSGRSDYLKKRNAFIDQPVNFVEIDLLLGGRRMPTECGLPPGDYYEIVARAEGRPDARVFAWTLRQAC